MGNRLELHDILCDILGNRNVYYQPPENIKMDYPAIRYERAEIRNVFADDKVYTQLNKYQVVVIDENPDSEIVKKVSLLPKCRFVNHFTKDNLNHDIFLINY